MNKIILLLCLALFYSTLADAGRRSYNNPFVTCERKITKMKSLWPGYLAKAREECMAMENPSNFSPKFFASNNKEAPTAKRKKNPLIICERKLTKIKSLWPGYTAKARQECMAMENPLEFDRDEFERKNQKPSKDWQ